MRLEGKATVVTGGGSGIGRAISRRFAREGASVLLTDTNEHAGEETTEGIISEGFSAEFFLADATEESDAQATVQQAVSQFGKLDLLVNNVGGSRGDRLDDITQEVWDWNLNLCLKANYLNTRAALPWLREQRGAIVNVATVNGMMGLAQDAYSAAKAGVIALTRNLAVRQGPEGVRVNAVAPGTIQTEAWNAAAEGDPYVFDRVASVYPSRRVGTPEDVANAALFLASDEAAFVNGAILTVDGGLTAGHEFFNRSVKGEMF